MNDGHSHIKKIINIFILIATLTVIMTPQYFEVYNQGAKLLSYALIGSSVFLLLHKHKDILLLSKREAKISILLLSAYVVPMFFSVEIWSSIQEIVRILFFLFLYIIIRYQGKAEAWRSAFMVVIVQAAAIISALAIIQYLRESYPSFRVTGPFLHFNSFSGLLAMILPLALYLITMEKCRFKAKLWFLSAVIISTSILLTFSRGTWISLTIALAIVFVVFNFQRRYLINAIAVFLCAIIVVNIAIFLVKNNDKETNPLSARALSLKDVHTISYVNRIIFWKDSISIIRDHPIFGTGPGAFQTVYTSYQSGIEYTRNPHNVILQLGSENGLPSLVIILTIVMTFLLSLLKKLKLNKSGDSEKGYEASVYFSSILVFIFHSMIDFDWVMLPNSFILILCAGMVKSTISNTPMGSQQVSSRIILMQRLLIGLILVPFFCVSITGFTSFVLNQDAKYEIVANNIPSARSKLVLATKINPFVSNSYRELSKLDLFMGNYIEAEQSAKRAIDLSRNNSLAHYQLAEVHRKRKIYSNAQKQYEKAIKLNSYDLTPYVGLADLYLEKGYSSKAESTLNAALKIKNLRETEGENKARSLIYQKLAFLYFERGEFAMSISMYKNAIEYDKNNINLYINIGYIFERIGRNQEARIYYRRGLSIDPKNVILNALLNKMEE